MFDWLPGNHQLLPSTFEQQKKVSVYILWNSVFNTYIAICSYIRILIFKFTIVISWQLLTVSLIHFSALDLMLTRVFLKAIPSVSLLVLLRACFDKETGGDLEPGECNHFILEASFNVPSALQASPLGLVISFWMLWLPVGFKFVWRLWPLLRDVSMLSSASYMSSASNLLCYCKLALYLRFPFLGASPVVT